MTGLDILLEKDIACLGVVLVDEVIEVSGCGLMMLFGPMNAYEVMRQ